uniref:Uncharacterized protein n=1 Tax=Paenibacillus wynnii TaxID=268407 RepID=A0A098MDY7_9BACL|nr:hypothetical protein [Paenibacillus wynnii]KGE20206.1 hypothetical protein PWYN_13350 [Paenibacillus wynnii]
MAKDEKIKEQAVSKLFTPEGKPIRVLSTSLGIALLANALLIPGTPAVASSGASGDEPQLVSWSTEEVKAYFDKNVDWNIPYPEEGTEVVQEEQGAVTTDGTTVINNYGGYHSGFGWDDLLLYHMLFNSGSFYSSRGWYNNHPGYYAGTRNSYKPRTYDNTKFQNKPVAGSVVKPRTSTSTSGSITRRGNAKTGGVGGTSSKLGSSKSGSKSGASKGSFGG